LPGNLKSKWLVRSRKTRGTLLYSCSGRSCRYFLKDLLWERKRETFFSTWEERGLLLQSRPAQEDAQKFDRFPGGERETYGERPFYVRGREGEED